MSGLFNEKKIRRGVFVMNKWYSMYQTSIELASVGVACCTFAAAFIFTAIHYADLDFSSVLTLGGGMQCLGFTMLSLMVRKTRSVRGLSAKSLRLYVLVFLFRLTSTLCKDGYIPLDKTGDWLFQLSDIACLGLVLQLLHRIANKDAETYRPEEDSLPVMWVLPAALVMSAFTYGDLDNSPIHDYAWMVATYLDTCAMLPQLFLLSRIGGTVEALTSHFVAAIFFSRAFTFSFWFCGYPEVAPLDGSFNTCGYAIVFLHFAQLITSGDFMYYYFKAVSAGKDMVLPELEV